MQQVMHPRTDGLGDGAAQLAALASGWKDDVSRIVQERPGAVLVAAVALGFLVGRLVSRR